MRLVFTVIPSNDIFNLVGPYYGTWLRDDQEEYVNKLRNKKEYKEQEENIKTNGILNPLIVNYGFIEPEILDDPTLFPKNFGQTPLEGHYILPYSEGSILDIAQRLELDVTCIVNDYFHKQSGSILRPDQVPDLYEDKPLLEWSNKGIKTIDNGCT